MNSDNEELLPIAVNQFRPLRTIGLMAIHLVYITILEVISVVILIDEHRFGEKCQPYFILIYLHGAHWFLSLLINQLLQREHRVLRMNGYLEFHRSTHNHLQLPLLFISLWTNTLCIIQAFIQESYFDNMEDKCTRSTYLTPFFYLLAFTTLELVVLGGIGLSYIYKVYSFNKIQPMPDVQNTEWRFTSSQASYVQDEIGHGIQQCRTTELLERQADLIEHLKHHNEMMNEKIMVLQSLLNLKNQST